MSLEIFLRVCSLRNVFSLWLQHLNLPEDFLSVKHIGDEHPNRSGHKVLGQVLSVGLAVGHSPAEGEVALKHFMAHIHENGVHTYNRAQKEEQIKLD